MFEADLPKRLRQFQLAFSSQESSRILYVPSGCESVATGSQERLEVVFGDLLICSVSIHLALPVDHAARRFRHAIEAARACILIHC